ncbi:polysaccharide pyruvyl transferase family protein [Paenibacillus sp. GCM10023252]|uniref:polysaccharide pyruvyl transferase family protein n=1 Tax=Paenibacillus sp. GCM10023252 TaxID=3252649 RepID=UPI0036184410
MRKVLLAGVPQSPNLGDGLIAHTINQLISMQGKHEVVHFDLLHGLWEDEQMHQPLAAVSGGSAAGAFAAAAVKPAAQARLNEAGTRKKMTPDALRRLKAYWLHRRKDPVMNEQLRRAVSEADAVYIGGGHLLIDTYWTFPLAVRRVAMEAKRQGKPLHLLLVGARGPWSRQAQWWLLEVCRIAATIAVRDEDSKKFLLQLDPKLASKTVALADPALYTPEAFNLAIEPEGPAEIELSPAERVMASGTGAVRQRVIGLGIMDPNEMNRHCEHRWEREDCAQWWSDAAQAIVSSGSTVRIFTNGAGTDNAFVEQYVKPLCKGNPAIELMPYPATVHQLVNSIAGCDAVIAQRLHACMPALSMNKPTYGVIWDKKLESIFTDIGLGSHLIDFRVPAEQAVLAAATTISRPEAYVKAMKRKKQELLEHMGRILP